MKNLLFLALIPALASAAPVINEFVAENQRGLTDADGAFSDWIEIYNPEATAVNMSGWFLTDNATLPQKWAFPAVTIQPGEFLIVFASGKDRAVAGSELHANFALEASGEYLALSQPGGAGVTTEFAPLFPNQRDGFSYGRSQKYDSTNVIAPVTPTWIVPTSEGALAADWNQTTMASAVGWQNGSGTGAVGYETASPPVTTGNISTTGAATQSTTNGAFTATVAKDANYTNFSHTLGTDAAPNWVNTFATDRQFASVRIFNRTSCCGSRLRDITVKVMDASGTAVFTSALLNPENAGYAYPNGPASIDLNLVALTGGYVTGRAIRIERTSDGDLSGTGGQGNSDEANVLSMAEVEIVAVTGGGAVGDTNLAPAGTASQTSTLSPYTANVAINGNTTDFTHTVNTDTSPKWTLNLGGRKILSKITLSNRTSCCGSRLRDITITVKDQDNSTVTYTSPLLNPENAGYAFPNGPASLEVDFTALTGGYIVGQYVEVTRAPDLDLSGTQGQGGPTGWVSGQVSDEGVVISLGEVTVTGNQYGNYTPLITTDVKAAMHNVSTSAFMRYPFTSAGPANVTAMKFRIRYDDAFIAYLNGVKIAERDAPVSPAWNSAATAGDRDDGAAVNFTEIDVSAFKNVLVTGNNVIAIHGLTSAAGDPDFLIQPQLVVDSLTVQPQLTFLRTITPGALNDSTWFLDFVADTSFSVKRGFYSATQNVAITTATAGATVRYTTNGSTPSETNGTVYTTPVAISTTTVLRARAFKQDWEPTNTDTQTYLFLTSVLGQTAVPPPNWPADPVVNGSGQSQRMNYGMDQNVRTLYGDTQMIEALTQIPTISIVTDQANLTDPQTGIYVNASGHGEDWERPASIEWLDPSKPVGMQGEFQHNCGIRIRGGASRSPSFFKHSLRVYFRNSYSVGKLNYPVFGSSGTNEHDVIDLASSQNYSWARLGEGNASFDTMLRDPFARRTLLDCGSPSTRTRYFHLYLNGIYWGLYWFDERVVSGFAEAYFGGKKDDYDVIKCGNRSTTPNFIAEATDGYLETLPGGGVAAWKDLWNKARAFALAPGVTQNGNPNLAAYFAILGKNADGTPNPAIPRLVDEDSLIDYMLCIFYTGDGDAPLSSFLSNNTANNWFCLRSRTNGMGFVFFNHDAEHTLGAPSSQNDRTGPFNGSNQNTFLYSNPQWLFQDLCFSPEFRMRVADRAHRHFFNNGTMTPAVAQARMDALAAQFNLAVKGHSMRWGDTLKSPAYNATDWQNAVNVARNYLTNRTTTVVSQLRAYNLTTAYPDASAPLYPLTAAPTLSQFGGNVSGGYSLTMSAPAGTIYYTTDGTDPRAIGGAVAGTQYTAGVQITAPLTVVKARALNAGTWSALSDATFYADTVDASAANIVVSELHYHPADPSPAEITAGFTDADSFEFLELTNIGATGVRLTGCYFDQGITFTFPASVLAPGTRIVIARDATAFQTRQGFAPAGAYAGGLSNSGENIRLNTPSGAVIKQFAFGVTAPWPGEPDGFGPSLVLSAPQTNPDHTLAANWRASTSLTPGGTDASNYASWKSANGVLSDTEDLDGDNLGAFLEYGTGGALNANSLALLPKVTRSGANIILTLKRSLAADDVTIAIEETETPPGWVPATIGTPVRTAANGIETITYTIPGGGAPGRHFRARYQAQ